MLFPQAVVFRQSRTQFSATTLTLCANHGLSDNHGCTASVACQRPDMSQILIE